MSNQPLVTIAIPSYKKKYLGKAIESAINQTYKNLEIIVVNDKSPEDIEGVVSQFDDKRIRYFVNKENLGGENPAHNWNRCLELAKGEYFAMLCDDDLYEPEFIETMLALADKYSQCGTFRSRADFVDANGKQINKYASAPEWESWEDYLWHVIRNYRSQTISEWMYRTETIRKAGGYALLPLAWYADYLSIFRIAQEGGIASTSQILVHFRQSGENISSRDDSNTEKKIMAAQEYRQAMDEMLCSHPDHDALIGGLDWLLRLHLKYNLEHAPRQVLYQLYKKRHKYRLRASWLWRAFWHK